MIIYVYAHIASSFASFLHTWLYSSAGMHSVVIWDFGLYRVIITVAGFCLIAEIFVSSWILYSVLRLWSFFTWLLIAAVLFCIAACCCHRCVIFCVFIFSFYAWFRTFVLFERQSLACSQPLGQLSLLSSAGWEMSAGQSGVKLSSLDERQDSSFHM